MIENEDIGGDGTPVHCDMATDLDRRIARLETLMWYRQLIGAITIITWLAVVVVLILGI